MEKALEIVKSLEKLPEAINFLKPVDYKALGLIDYPVIIKNPIDLSTIRKKIKAEKYNCIEEVIEDLNLIWENCRTYNQAGSVILLFRLLLQVLIVCKINLKRFVKNLCVTTKQKIVVE